MQVRMFLVTTSITGILTFVCPSGVSAQTERIHQLVERCHTPRRPLPDRLWPWPKRPFPARPAPGKPFPPIWLTK
jgi:hypothetical protein